MRRYLSALALVGSFATTLIGCGGSGGGPGATPTPAPTATPTPTPSPTPVPLRTYNLAVSGSRGSIPLLVSGLATSIVPAAPKSVVTPISAVAVLSAPATYGDRTFVAWQRNGTNFSTSVALASLPSELVNGDTITAVYGPGGTRTTPLTPNFNQTDFLIWPAPTQAALKIFFTAGISSAYQDVFREGIDLWVKALGSSFAYTIVATEAEANIVITSGDLGGGQALTSVTFTTGAVPQKLTKATMTFDLTKLPSLTNTANRPVLIALAAHEFGHALGINGGGIQGHSSDPKDVMFPTVTVDTTSITLRDINTMMNNYVSLFDGRHRAAHPTAPAGAVVTQNISCSPIQAH